MMILKTQLPLLPHGREFAHSIGADVIVVVSAYCPSVLTSVEFKLKSERVDVFEG